MSDGRMVASDGVKGALEFPMLWQQRDGHPLESVRG